MAAADFDRSVQVRAPAVGLPTDAAILTPHTNSDQMVTDHDRAEEPPPATVPNCPEQPPTSSPFKPCRRPPRDTGLAGTRTRNAYWEPESAWDRRRERLIVDFQVRFQVTQGCLPSAD